MADKRPNEYTFLVYKLVPREEIKLGSEGVLSPLETCYAAEISPRDPPRDSITGWNAEVLARSVLELYVLRADSSNKEKPESCIIKHELPGHELFFSNPSTGTVCRYGYLLLDDQEKKEFSRELWRKWTEYHQSRTKKEK